MGIAEKTKLSPEDLVQSYDATLEALSAALDIRDEEARGHGQRVTEMTLRLAKALGVKDDALAHIRRGALLHDIGNMRVPESILRKQGELTAEEWVVIHLHPYYAHEFMAPIELLRPAVQIPYCHHEKWNGTGYPRGLAGAQIPREARIFAVIDVWDTLTSRRPYREAWPEARARQYIQEQAGQHFDPDVVEHFLPMKFDRSPTQPR